MACQEGHTDVVQQLLMAGADANATTASGVTPLYLASQGGFDKAVRWLIASGADGSAGCWCRRGNGCVGS